MTLPTDVWQHEYAQIAKEHSICHDSSLVFEFNAQPARRQCVAAH